MSKPKASITQSEIDRAVKAGKKVGAAEVEVRIHDEGITIFFRMEPSSTAEGTKALEGSGGIVL